MKTITKYKNLLLASLIFFTAGYFITPKKETVKEVVKYVTVEVEKKKTKKVTTVKESTSKDGSSIKETTVVEDSSSETSKETSRISEKTSTSRGVAVGLLAIKDLNAFSDKPEFGAVVSVPIIGRLSAIASADTTKRVGLGLSLEF
jgi:hypothetical protein